MVTTDRRGLELRVTLPGNLGSSDAMRAIGVIQRLLSILTLLESADGADARRGGAGTWRFSDLAIGSVVATLAPGEPGAGGSFATMERALDTAVAGFDAAERTAGIPDGWDIPAAQVAADLAKLLSSPGDEVLLDLIVQGRTVRAAIVTQTAERNLAVGLAERRRSIGSAIGRLDTATLHHRREASLWLERTDERVPVSFEAADIDTIRSAWGRRVEIRGMLERDHDGKLVRVRMRHLEILADRGDSPPIMDLVGLDPDLTGGLAPAEYLGEIRDAT